jgi:hypothetical protein
MARQDRKTTKKVAREQYQDPTVNPEHWVSRWETGQLDSIEERRNAAHAINKSGFALASPRYAEFVRENINLSEED